MPYRITVEWHKRKRGKDAVGYDVAESESSEFEWPSDAAEGMLATLADLKTNTRDLLEFDAGPCSQWVIHNCDDPRNAAECKENRRASDKDWWERHFDHMAEGAEDSFVHNRWKTKWVSITTACVVAKQDDEGEDDE